MESVHGIYKRHDGTRLNTYKVVNAPVVGCRNWGAAWLRVGVLVGVASAVSTIMKKDEEARVLQCAIGHVAVNVG